MAEEEPDRYLAKAIKAKRGGRIFIDYLRNGRGATAIAPFSTRVRSGAPVAWPVSWAELAGCEDAGPRPSRRRRLLLKKREADPWAGYFKRRPETSRWLSCKMPDLRVQCSAA